MNTVPGITPSVARVPLHTPTEINSRIRHATNQRLAHFREHPEGIGRRLVELNEEWDIERMLATGSSFLSLLGLIVGLRASRRWLYLALGVQSFYLQHTIQGWCPPLPILRRLGFRTPMEIEYERCGLKAVREELGAESPMHTAVDAEAPPRQFSDDPWAYAPRSGSS
jgi:hypothetical protein